MDLAVRHNSARGSAQTGDIFGRDERRESVTFPASPTKVRVTDSRRSSLPDSPHRDGRIISHSRSVLSPQALPLKIGAP
jgi:hypothetical protein